jgi:predicted transcriptional regulator
MSKRNSDPANQSVVEELEAIKRLLVLSLVKAGAKQKEIAMALQVGQAEVSRMFPARKVERFVNVN